MSHSVFQHQKQTVEFVNFLVHCFSLSFLRQNMGYSLPKTLFSHPQEGRWEEKILGTVSVVGWYGIFLPISNVYHYFTQVELAKLFFFLQFFTHFFTRVVFTLLFINKINKF